jgi:hypothetical protein
MLTNYYNVGFIHLLYPNALILHVAREPMDTIFSAYKHEFPPGTLDYTSDFGALAELYHAYRDLMEHWDRVLPGRVTHVRYQDMVNDMPGVARAIISESRSSLSPADLTGRFAPCIFADTSTFAAQQTRRGFLGTRAS